MSPRDKEATEDSVLQRPLEATREMCLHCFHVLVKELTSSSHMEHDHGFVKTIPEAVECPLFVTWDKKRLSHCQEPDFRLRGCIGTLSPRPLSTSITEYALTSALRDRRFDPIRLHEVPHLRVAVSLLVNYEVCSHCHDWSVGIHGIIIKFTIRGVEYSATYLPEVAHEQGWTQQEAVRSLVRKAGYHGEFGHALAKGIHCTRYQSSKHRVTYQEYANIIGADPLAKNNNKTPGSCVSM